ncbi:MAG: hypothetical protein AAFN70_11955, partial [Planctomycetota bacterium]
MSWIAVFSGAVQTPVDGLRVGFGWMRSGMGCVCLQSISVYSLMILADIPAMKHISTHCSCFLQIKNICILVAIFACIGLMAA